MITTVLVTISVAYFLFVAFVLLFFRGADALPNSVDLGGN